MALTLDGLKVLGDIAANPVAFPAIVSEAEKLARSLVVKQLKAKTSGLDTLRSVNRALGNEFILVVEGMSDAEVKSLLSKVDKHYPDLKTAPGDQLRSQLNALAAGTAEPRSKTGSSGKSSNPRTSRRQPPAPPERLSSPAMAAVRKR